MIGPYSPTALFGNRSPWGLQSLYSGKLDLPTLLGRSATGHGVGEGGFGGPGLRWFSLILGTITHYLVEIGIFSARRRCR